jgi:hypothetical protein
MQSAYPVLSLDVNGSTASESPSWPMTSTGRSLPFRAVWVKRNELSTSDNGLVPEIEVASLSQVAELLEQAQPRRTGF